MGGDKRNYELVIFGHVKGKVILSVEKSHRVPLIHPILLIDLRHVSSMRSLLAHLGNSL